jgi:hypothetical protein
LAVVEFGPFARLLKLSAFPLPWWGLVTLVAVVTTVWSEPLKRSR